MTGAGSTSKRFVHIVVVVTAALALIFGLSTGAPEQARPVRADESIVLVSAAVPQRAWDTLARIDAGTWPPNDGSGTKGGGVWSNREGRLPATDSAGSRIAYQEWDVNIKKPGQTRDAERIVTGSDRSAWYTGDHYASFTRMR
ncbi:ribonuclease domain-containing protein [Nocardia sp. CS682]|uniref:ribonuclease domain-containing protein n=1 Tax=Nocardia sp. CS682 TaxID=1047172 RepID=UPI001075532F|nr:ribonuclease domain-containing protein [Nocardia sp. CS682]QBS40321.1 ribonuclease [Nocardia sp. CS682]